MVSARGVIRIPMSSAPVPISMTVMSTFASGGNLAREFGIGDGAGRLGAIDDRDVLEAENALRFIAGGLSEGFGDRRNAIVEIEEVSGRRRTVSSIAVFTPTEPR